MKRILLLVAGFGLFLTSCVSNPEGEKAETTDAKEVVEAIGGTYFLETQESALEWTGRKVSATHHGTINFQQGTVTIADNKLAGGKFVIDMTSIQNLDLEGEWKGKLEGHLYSPDFFDVENYEESIFEITGVEATENANQVVVSGNLTIKDVTKNITFPANVEVSNEVFKMNADFNIEREEWGINYTGMADDLIAKEINYKVSVVAYGNN